MRECNNLDEVREEIDRIDQEIVRLLGERGGYVRQAARFKQTADDVRAPQRVEAVIARVRGMAAAHGLSPDIVERVYRAMIAAFVDYEMHQHHLQQEP